MSGTARITIITVFHNSEIFFDRYVDALRMQTRLPDLVVLIDSGSHSPAYLKQIEQSGLNHRLELHENIGFCKGNNLGYALSEDAEFIFFLNPDAYPQPDYIECCLRLLQTCHTDVGAVSGALLGFDIHSGQPTGRLDSTGIVQTWYGRLIDRNQGEFNKVLVNYPLFSDVPALCGASMLCRRQALNSVAVTGMVFDESFFSYKEDIDLSWRLRASGWRLLFLPSPQVHHCRGWKQRSEIRSQLKLLSARNEVLLYKKHHSFYLLSALLKYFLVKVFSL